ncbi:hypothetical protein BDB01DRAFT_788407 [Pilobolus umbonatus]|nr:hypothetical protein BDB01DRAFT_788407 [Pilobolus umbonatus]
MSVFLFLLNITMTLYETLCHILDTKFIDEIGILFDTFDKNKLPIDSQGYYPLILIDTKLGISLNTLKTLLKEAHEHYINTPRDDYTRLEQVTRIMIFLKPDNYSALNKRKKMMTLGYIQPQDELNLIKLIFTWPRHSKSSDAWYHRQWILTTYPDTANYDQELSLCTLTTEKYPRNYYSWTYRYWILSNFLNKDKRMKEYHQSKAWVALNISDYSGFHYLEQCMKLITLDGMEHMKWIDELICKYPGHESLWCHRRFCTHLYMKKYGVEFCHYQHQFIQKVISSADEKQKEYALRFGLWQTLLEKKWLHQVYAPPHLLKSYYTHGPEGLGP